MPDAVQTFLAAAGWLDAEAQPMAGDMSSRRYTRLTGRRGRAILMQAATPQTPFTMMTAWLRTLDLSVPEILADQAGDGLLLLEDLGDLPVARLLAGAPDRAGEVYAGCAELLLRIRRAETPMLPRPEASELAAWTRIADHYPGADTAVLSRFRDVLQDCLAETLAEGVSVSLRDFHTDNMMWLPEREGLRRFGLLDYQDAFLTHPCYDLVSLLTDARVTVPRELRNAVIDTYLARSGDDPESFARAFAVFSVQRNLRILGLFASSGRHLSALPRVHGYVRQALDHPVFEDVREAALDALPTPVEII